eukprot:scaffold9821_cov47-Attheya_sp.AAC.5
MSGSAPSTLFIIRNRSVDRAFVLEQKLYEGNFFNKPLFGQDTMLVFFTLVAKLSTKENYEGPALLRNRSQGARCRVYVSDDDFLRRRCTADIAPSSFRSYPSPLRASNPELAGKLRPRGLKRE